MGRVVFSRNKAAIVQSTMTEVMSLDRPETSVSECMDDKVEQEEVEVQVHVSFVFLLLCGYVPNTYL